MRPALLNALAALVVIGATAALGPGTVAPATSATAATTSTAATAQIHAKRGAAHVRVPRKARAVRARATRFVGHGTAASCTSRAVVRAVAAGGVIKFRCGPKPVTIKMHRTAKVVNTSHRVVLDGGNKVTLDGMGVHRILYQNTCDKKQIWTTARCDNQPYPRLVLQHITFTRGFNGLPHSSAQLDGGGAVYARGGRLKIVDTRFIRNRCRATGPEVGGGAVRAFEEFQGRPVYVVGSVFRGGRCSNGAALSSIGVSWSVYNSAFRNNHATGGGAAGGGGGGAMYGDGNTYNVLLAGVTMTGSVAVGGGGIYFVSNDRSGHLRVRRSTLVRNRSTGYQTYPGIFYLGDGPARFIHSIVR